VSAARSRTLALPAELLASLPEQRWFAGKARRIADARVLDSAAELWLAEVVYTDGGPSDTYLLTETLAAETWLERFRQGRVLETSRGARLAFCATRVLGGIDSSRTRPAEPLRAEQSNTSIRYGDALVFKLFRRIQLGGENPDVEIGRFLTERTDFADTPAVAGTLDYTAVDGSLASFGLLQQFVPNRGDAWQGTLQRLDGVLSGERPVDSAVEPVRQLGVTTARLHAALASDHALPRFAPEPIGDRDTAEWRAALEAEVRQTATALDGRATLDLAALLQRAAGIDALRGSRKTRHHGDYHLGQVLERPDGSFAIIDFEGEPSRPLAMRTQKRSPLRDVAGLLRSLDYARHAALRAGESSDAEPQQRRARADTWHDRARQAFLDGYLGTLRPTAPDLLPSDGAPLDAALSALELEKAAYEVRYELAHRPDWLPIPLAAFTCR
jgi:maltose alpha-D-glucosyltransferase/alpha-amylase